MTKSLIQNLQDQLKELVSHRPPNLNKDLWRKEISDLKQRINKMREPTSGLTLSGTMQSKAWCYGERYNRQTLGSAWDNKRQTVTDWTNDSDAVQLSRRQVFMLNREKQQEYSEKNCVRECSA